MLKKMLKEIKYILTLQKNTSFKTVIVVHTLNCIVPSGLLLALLFHNVGKGTLYCISDAIYSILLPAFGLR